MPARCLPLHYPSLLFSQETLIGSNLQQRGVGLTGPAMRHYVVHEIIPQNSGIIVEEELLVSTFFAFV
jgi:hypothetical protein